MARVVVGSAIAEKGRRGQVVAHRPQGMVDVQFEDVDFIERRPEDRLQKANPAPDLFEPEQEAFRRQVLALYEKFTSEGYSNNKAVRVQIGKKSKTFRPGQRLSAKWAKALAYQIATRKGQRYGYLEPGSQAPTSKGLRRAQEKLDSDDAWAKRQRYELMLSRGRKAGKHRVVPQEVDGRIRYYVQPGNRYFMSQQKADQVAAELNGDSSPKRSRKKQVANPLPAILGTVITILGVGELVYMGGKWAFRKGKGRKKDNPEWRYDELRQLPRGLTNFPIAVAKARKYAKHMGQEAGNLSFDIDQIQGTKTRPKKLRADISNKIETLKDELRELQNDVVNVLPVELEVAEFEKLHREVARHLNATFREARAETLLERSRRQAEKRRMRKHRPKRRNATSSGYGRGAFRAGKSAGQETKRQRQAGKGGTKHIGILGVGQTMDARSGRAPAETHHPKISLQRGHRRGSEDYYIISFERSYYQKRYRDKSGKRPPTLLTQTIRSMRPKWVFAPGMSPYKAGSWIVVGSDGSEYEGGSERRADNTAKRLAEATPGETFQVIQTSADTGRADIIGFRTATSLTSAKAKAAAQKLVTKLQEKKIPVDFPGQSESRRGSKATSGVGKGSLPEKVGNYTLRGIAIDPSPRPTRPPSMGKFTLIFPKEVKFYNEKLTVPQLLRQIAGAEYLVGDHYDSIIEHLKAFKKVQPYYAPLSLANGKIHALVAQAEDAGHTYSKGKVSDGKAASRKNFQKLIDDARDEYAAALHDIERRGGFRGLPKMALIGHGPGSKISFDPENASFELDGPAAIGHVGLAKGGKSLALTWRPIWRKSTMRVGRRGEDKKSVPSFRVGSLGSEDLDWIAAVYSGAGMGAKVSDKARTRHDTYQYRKSKGADLTHRQAPSGKRTIIRKFRQATQEDVVDPAWRPTRQRSVDAPRYERTHARLAPGAGAPRRKAKKELSDQDRARLLALLEATANPARNPAIGMLIRGGSRLARHAPKMQRAASQASQAASRVGRAASKRGKQALTWATKSAVGYTILRAAVEAAIYQAGQTAVQQGKLTPEQVKIAQDIVTQETGYKPSKADLNAVAVEVLQPQGA